MNKGTKLYSILTATCPRCHTGPLFVAGPYNLRRAGKVFSHCPVCGLRYEREPAFFYGAMYVTYALQVFIVVATYVILDVLAHPDFGVYVGVVAAVVLLTFPVILRLSRVIWINFFVRYNPTAKGE